jgi:hypothetical protein
MTFSPLFFADMVRENSLSTGTGQFALSGAPTGYQDFAGTVPTGTPFHYNIASVTVPSEWESGIGSLSNGGQLVRTSVTASSDNGALVNFSAGTKSVSLTVGASWYDDVQDGRVVQTLSPDMPDLNSQLRSSLEVIDVAPPAGMANSAGGDDGVNLVFQTSTGRFNQGPTGHANYYNTVCGWGQNCAPSWGSLNAALPAISDRWEMKFAQGGPSDPFGAERHMSLFATPAQGDAEYRLFTAFAPHDKNLWATKSDIGLRAAVIYFNDIDANGVGNQRLLLDMRPGTDAISITNPPTSSNALQFQYGQNDRAIFTQLNAAGNAFLALPYLNNRNELELNNTPFYIAAPGLTSLFGLKSSFTHMHLSPAANDVVRYTIANGAVTGSVTGERFEMTATGDALMDYRNLGTGKIAINLVAAGGGGEYRVNGQKVVGDRGAALPANAADLASAITLLNAVKARMIAHGLVAP